MTKYREILSLKRLGFSDRNIAHSVSCSRNTVPRVLGKAEEHGMPWSSPDDVTDGVIKKYSTRVNLLLQTVLITGTNGSENTSLRVLSEWRLASNTTP